MSWSKDPESMRIQIKTFTRWCNKYLKQKDVAIDDLRTGLSDGTNLIILLELLSQKKVGRYNKKNEKRQMLRSHCMENLEIALNFIAENERLKLVNIGAGDIVDGNLKLILGLIWTLILHYQISRAPDVNMMHGGSPQQALLAWVQNKVTVANFTTDWNDGMAITMLVDSLTPSPFPELGAMTTKDALENTRRAIGLAQKWLGVPQYRRRGEEFLDTLARFLCTTASG